MRLGINEFEPQPNLMPLADQTRWQRDVSMIGKRNFRKAGITGSDHIFSAISQLQSSLAMLFENRESQIQQLLTALENGELIALGFPIHSTKLDKREPVPQFLIQRRFSDINKSEFGDGSYRYAKVRIFPATTHPERKIGRPSDKGRIFDIAETLAAQGIINSTMPPKVQAAKVRGWEIRKLPSDFSETKPADQTIQRHLKVFWKSKVQDNTLPDF